MAPSQSATAIVGPSGATIVLGEVTLVVPPGALTTETSITVSETDELAAGGYSAYTHVYGFAPQGLAFERPASVTFRLPAVAPRVRVVWTDAGTWEELGGVVSGSSITAPIEHFSYGFAGALLEEDGGSTVEDAGLDGGSDAPTDDSPIAPVEDAPIEDAGTGDAAAEDVGIDASTFACTQTFPRFDATRTACHATCTSPFFSHAIGQLTLTEASQLTAWRRHGSTTLTEGVGFGLGCAHPDNACGYPATSGIATWEVPAGTYFYDTCGGMDWVVESPPAPPENTSCANAIAIDTALPGRIVRDVDLYYFYDWRDVPPPDVADQMAQAESPVPYSQVHVSVRTVCDDPASEVYALRSEEVGPLWDGGTPGSFPLRIANFDTIHAATPAPRYYLVVNGILPGTTLRTRSILASP